MTYKNGLMKFLASSLACIFWSFFLLPGLPALAQETYRFERMVPTLQQPWYFSSTRGMGIDSVGNIYITDAWNSTVVKLTSNGQLITSWGGEGTGNGQFKEPVGIGIDHDGNVYVSDKTLNRIQKFTSDGDFIKAWGSSGSADGQFSRPLGIYVIDEEYLYVIEEWNNRVQKFTLDGDHVSSHGEYGSGAGQLNSPSDMAFDGAGNIYISEQGNHRIQKFSSSWESLDMWGSYGSGPGEFNTPTAIHIDENDTIYVAEFYNNRIQLFRFESGQYVSTGMWGELGSGDGQFWGPIGIAQDKDGNFYVTQYWNGRVQKFSKDLDFLTSWQSWSQNTGMLHGPYGVAADAAGNVYVSDAENHRIQKFSPGGVLLTSFGSLDGNPGSGDGQLNKPWGIAVDADGVNVYVADTENDRIQRYIDDGQGGYVYHSQWTGFTSGKAIFNNPRGVAGVAVDKDGNVFVADTFNHMIKKFTPDGVLLTEWGGLSDYAGEDGKFRIPLGLVVDNSGNVYVADTYNDRIQKFVPVSDGDGGFTYSFERKWGTLGADEGQFDKPYEVGVDIEGNVYVADPYNERIQVFNTNGEFITVIGEKGTNPGQFRFPTDVAGGPNNKIYVADYFNNRVQTFKKVSLAVNSKAIIVAGGGPFPGNNLWDATQMNANFAYRTLVYQGYTKENIFYLTADIDLDLDKNGILDDVDGDATNANLEQAITQWASDADDLVIYLVDHGGKTSFRMSGNQLLKATDLNSWLDTLQLAAENRIILIYDACDSGNFTAPLAPPNGMERVVITSTSPDEPAYFISRGMISFSNAFWTHIFNGLSLKESFDLADQSMAEYQNPRLDDSGNGVGDEPGDGAIAQNAYIGNRTLISGARPVIGSVSDPQTINDTSSAVISASGVTDDDGIARVWALLRPPNFNLESTDNPVQELPSIDLLPVIDSPGDYTASYDGFNSTGTYQIAIYAQDRAGNTSVPELTSVSVNNPMAHRAIILAGGAPSDDLWPAIESNVKLSYEALSFQGYGVDDIYLLSPASIPGVTKQHVLNTYDNLKFAVETWAAENTQDLVIYLVGKTENGSFRINQAETLAGADLDAWLDLLQDVDSPQVSRVTLIYDASQAGTFLPAMTPPVGQERILVAAAADNESAYFLAQGTISFSNFFWRRVLNGTNVYNSFVHARQAIQLASGRRQNPSLDDSGNGIGNEKSVDGKIARNYTLGFGLMLAGDEPIINSISPDQILNGSAEAEIWVDGVTATGVIDKVWAVVTPPGYSPDIESAVVSSLPTFPLDHQISGPDDTGKYSGTFIGFSQTGEHIITVYAADTSGNLSLPAETKVTQQTGTDAFEDDDSPENASVITINASAAQSHNFHDEGDQDWIIFYGMAGENYAIQTENPDPNSDTVLTLFDYTGVNSLATQDDYGPGKGEILSWESPADGIYYVRISQYPGAGYGQNTSYQFRIYNPVGAFPGYINGVVTDSISGAPMSLTRIRTDANVAALSLPGTGVYLMLHPAGNFTLTAESSGYEIYTSQVTVTESVVVNLNIPMTSLCLPPAAPQGLTSEGNCGSGYTISWGPVDGATSYTLERATDSLFTNPAQIYEGNSTSYSESSISGSTYFYRVRASNSCGDSDWTNEVVLACSQISNIGLSNGWNLISLPKQQTDTSIDNVLGTIVNKYDSVWAYINGQWKSYDPVQPFFSDLTDMQAGVGYWIKMKEPGELTVSGPEPLTSINLSDGWNLVGFNGSEVKDTETAMTSISGKYISVWAYVNGQWKSYDPNQPFFSDLNNVTPGVGYWIKTSEACTWSLP